MYEIASVTTNLRPEESYVQIANSLKSLLKVSETIFEKITTRLTSYEKKIDNCHQRLNRLEQNITLLSENVNTMKIPSPNMLGSSMSSYRSVFNDVALDRKLQLKLGHGHCDRDDASIDYRQCSLQTIEQYLDTVAVPQISVDRNYLKLNSNRSHLRGLGPIREHLQFIIDVFLFNTHLNVYNDRSFDYNYLNNINQFPKSENSNNINGPGPDQNITLNTNNIRKSISGNNGDYDEENSDFYLPESVQIPNLGLPQKLPKILEITKSLSYHEEEEEEEEEEEIKSEKTVENNVTENLENTENDTNIIEIPETNTNEMIDVKNDDVSLEKTVIKPITKPVNPVPDLKSDLMKAIREFGGLKNTGLKRVQKPVDNEKVESNDLISDLSRVLSLRRKGIHGHTAKESSLPSSNRNIFDNISNLISQTVSSSESSSSQNEESDNDWS